MVTEEIEPERVLAGVLRPVARRLPEAVVSLYLIDTATGELVLEGQVETRARETASGCRATAASRAPCCRPVGWWRPTTRSAIRASTRRWTRPRTEWPGPCCACRCACGARCSGVFRVFPSRGVGASARTGEMLSAALSAAVRNVLLYRSLLESIDEVARRAARGRERIPGPMKELIDKAEVLIEALPYMRRFYDKTIVIKYGGSAMSDDALRASFAVDVVLLKYIGLRPVIVHGGGPQIGATLERLGKKSTFVDGLRVTDDETMEVVEMVLGGKVNREIVELVQQGGGRAIGLTGSDGGMIRVTRRLEDDRDLGRVGKVVAVDPAPIAAVADAGFVPVIAPIGVDDDGVTHNVNADEAAGAIAGALAAEKLILLTDVEGVLRRPGRADSAARRRGGAQAHRRGHDPRRDDSEDRVLHRSPRARGRAARTSIDGRIAPRHAARDLHRRRRRHAADPLRHAEGLPHPGRLARRRASGAAASARTSSSA